MTPGEPAIGLGASSNCNSASRLTVISGVEPSADANAAGETAIKSLAATALEPTTTSGPNVCALLISIIMARAALAIRIGGSGLSTATEAISVEMSSSMAA